MWPQTVEAEKSEKTRIIQGRQIKCQRTGDEITTNTPTEKTTYLQKIKRKKQKEL